MNERARPPDGLSRVDTILSLIDRTLHEYEIEVAQNPALRPGKVRPTAA